MSPTIRPKAAGCLAALVALAGAAQADEAADDAGVISVIIENDSVDGGDGHYTSGVALSWLGAESDAPEFANRIVRWAPFWPEDASVRPTLALGQKMFTPEDILTPGPQPSDRPYAGYLYLSGGLVMESDSGRVDQLELSLGVVGPAALGEEAQTLAHAIGGFGAPAGWENQLQNEPALLATYQRSWRRLFSAELLGVGADVTPHLGGALGNVYTYANAGATVRVGLGLDQDQGVPRLQPGGAGAGGFGGDGLGAYVFAGVDGRAVAQNIFLDGNTFQESPSVDKEPFVADLALGAAVSVENVRLSYTHVLRTREFEGQDENDSYGSLSLSVGF